MNKIIFTVFLLTSCGSVPNSANNSNDSARSQNTSEKIIVIKEIFDTLTKKYNENKITKVPSIDEVKKHYEIIYNILTELAGSTVTITPSHVKKYFATNKNYDSIDAFKEDVNRRIGIYSTTYFDPADKSIQKSIIVNQLNINLKSIDKLSHQTLKTFIENMKTKLEVEDLSSILKDQAVEDILSTIVKKYNLSLDPKSVDEAKKWTAPDKNSIYNVIKLIKGSIFNNIEENYFLLLINFKEDKEIKHLLEERANFVELLDIIGRKITLEEKKIVNSELIKEIKEEFNKKIKA